MRGAVVEQIVLANIVKYTVTRRASSWEGKKVVKAIEAYDKFADTFFKSNILRVIEPYIHRVSKTHIRTIVAEVYKVSTKGRATFIMDDITNVDYVKFRLWLYNNLKYKKG